MLYVLSFVKYSNKHNNKYVRVQYHRSLILV